MAWFEINCKSERGKSRISYMVVFFSPRNKKRLNGKQDLKRKGLSLFSTPCVLSVPVSNGRCKYLQGITISASSLFLMPTSAIASGTNAIFHTAANPATTTATLASNNIICVAVIPLPHAIICRNREDNHLFTGAGAKGQSLYIGKTCGLERLLRCLLSFSCSFSYTLSPPQLSACEEVLRFWLSRCSHSSTLTVRMYITMLLLADTKKAMVFSRRSQSPTL